MACLAASAGLAAPVFAQQHPQCYGPTEENFARMVGGDQDHSGEVNAADVGAFSEAFAAGSLAADHNGDLEVDGADVTGFFSDYAAGG